MLTPTQCFRLFSTLLLCLVPVSEAFAPTRSIQSKPTALSNKVIPSHYLGSFQPNLNRHLSKHVLFYNNRPPPLLPPPQKDDWQGIANSLLTFGAVVAIFASPLGGIIFGIFNSLLLISILLPILAVVAFQIWQATSTIEGACPACGAPVRVAKNDASALEPNQPSLCLNCGSVVQASLDNTEIFVAQTGPGVQPPPDEGFFSSLFGGDQSVTKTTTTATTTTTTSSERKGDQFRRERTIIDVEVEE